MWAYFGCMLFCAALSVMLIIGLPTTNFTMVCAAICAMCAGWNLAWFVSELTSRKEE